MSSTPPAPPPAPAGRWQRLTAAVAHAYRVYVNWLVGISWKRFWLLSLLLIIAASLLKELPPFGWTLHEEVEVVAPPKPRRARTSRTGTPRPPARFEISIGDDGVKITPKHAPPAAPAAAASAAATPSAPADPAAPAPPAPPAMAQPENGDESEPSVRIRLPKGAVADEVRQAVEEARRDIEQAVHDARQAERDATDATAELPRTRVTRVQLGDYLVNLALLLILGSAIIKLSYKGRLQAEVKAAKATETAESESLKRQVIEARMAAMQAQVEPHFLFNTLASIDHLIETDPPRASRMQKNLIALLRASMPSMRDVNPGATPGSRDLGRELAVIRPYLEILKVRMEERLTTEIRVSDGLLSAEFPPMMLQSLVENAIKHGLEPKPEGGRLSVAAEIVHGKLAVTVADSGLGFGHAPTAGTGIGLSNIRERLQLLYGHRASLQVAENPGGGTAVTITVPYQSTADAAGDAAAGQRA